MPTRSRMTSAEGMIYKSRADRLDPGAPRRAAAPRHQRHFRPRSQDRRAKHTRRRDPAVPYAGIFNILCALPHTIFSKMVGEVERFRTVSVSRATHLPARRAAAGLLAWLTPPPWPSVQLQSLPNSSLSWCRFEEVGGELRIARQRVVARVGRHVAEEVRVIAEQLVGDAAARDRAGRIGRLVVIVGADVGPERVGVADERRLRIGLQHRLEGLREAGAPRAFVREVIDFLEVDEDRHLQVSRQRIDPAQLRAVGGDVELQLAEALRARP